MKNKGSAGRGTRAARGIGSKPKKSSHPGYSDAMKGAGRKKKPKSY